MIISYYVAQALQFSFRDSLFLALGMSISSTIVIVRILEELNMIRTNHYAYAGSLDC